MYDVFRAVVREEVHPTFYGSKVCNKCARAIDDIEDLYRFDDGKEHMGLEFVKEVSYYERVKWEMSLRFYNF